MHMSTLINVDKCFPIFRKDPLLRSVFIIIFKRIYVSDFREMERSIEIVLQ